MTRGPEETTQFSVGGLIAAIAAISVAAAGFGHSLPLFSILLKTYGASDATIGFNTAVAALAAIIATPFFPKLIHRMGLKPFLLMCIAIMVLSYGGLYLAGDNIPLWYPLRFAFGFAGAGLFAGSEIWINKLAPPKMRGRIIGIYSTFLALGFALGPLLVDLFGYEGALPFVVGMIVFASAALPIALVSAPPASTPDAAKGFFKFLPKAPATFIAAAIFAGLESAVLIFLPVLAIDQGWGADVGARAVSVYGFGILALQYVIGRYADIAGHNRMLVLCALGGFFGAMAFWLTEGSVMVLYAVLFVWGGLIAGLYTVGLTLIGERFGTQDITATNTGFVFMYGVGAIIGPVAAGLVREWAGPEGLNLFLVSTLGAYSLLVWVRRKERRP